MVNLEIYQWKNDCKRKSYTTLHGEYRFCSTQSILFSCNKKCFLIEGDATGEMRVHNIDRNYEEVKNKFSATSWVKQFPKREVVIDDLSLSRKIKEKLNRFASSDKVDFLPESLQTIRGIGPKSEQKIKEAIKEA